MKSGYKHFIHEHVLGKPWAVVLLLLLAMHVLIYYDLLLSWPEIIQGRQFIARDELVPIFNWQSQYFDQIRGGGLNLTYSNEVRLGYSFWTAWLRGSAVMPLGLIGLGTLSAFLYFLSAQVLLKDIFKARALRAEYYIAFGALFGTLPFYLILLYAKVTTFYSLVIGFAMFALAISLLLRQFLFNQNWHYKQSGAIALLVLLNPAIHYHVLFYFLFGLFSVVALVFYLIRKRYAHLLQIVRHGLFIGVLSGVPYAILILFSIKQSGSDVGAQIPLNYWSIFYNSLPLPHLLAFNMTAQIDVGRSGNYILQTPRMATEALLVFITIGYLMILRTVRHTPVNYLTTLLALLLIASTWMSIGYGSGVGYTFHNAVGDVVSINGNIPMVGDLINKVLYMFLNILRFPHRFQFIQFYAASILLSLSIVYFIRHKFGLRTKHILLIVVLLVFAPFIIERDYRNVLLFGKGNMGGYLAPYTVPPELEQIKVYLAGKQDVKLFILPSLESGRTVRSNNIDYSFIDKTLIYYLNQPTYYYGAGATVQNKVMAERIYTAIYQNRPDWQSLLADNLRINYILVPKNTKPNTKQVQYYPNFDVRLDNALKRQRYKVVVDGPNYQLYEENVSRSQARNLVDVTPDNFTKALASKAVNTPYVLPVQFSEVLKSGRSFVLYSDNLERSRYTLRALIHKDKVGFPDTSRLPYQSQNIESSVFATTGVSLQILNKNTSEYNLFKEKMPSMAQVAFPRFVGTAKESKGIRVNIKSSGPGQYRLFLAAASRADSLTVQLADRQYRAALLRGRQDGSNTETTNYRIYSFAADLPLGTNQLTVLSDKKYAILINSVYTERSGSRNRIHISETNMPRVFNVEIQH